jgi:ATP-dependent exoDNAse (exonuclease V) beta subunit
MENKYKAITRDASTRRYKITLDSRVIYSNTSVTSYLKLFFPQFNAIDAYEKMGKRSLEKYTGMTRDQVLASWNEKGIKSAREGTKMHADIENFIKFGKVSHTNEMSKYIDFVDTVCKPIGLKAEKVEQKIFVQLPGNKCLAGEVDYIGKDRDGNVYIIDWKRIENLQKTAYGNFGYGLHCCDRLENVKYNYYSLQLHLYRYMLMHTYDMVINPEHLLICNLHPDNDTYQYYVANDVSNIVEKMIGMFPDMVD